MRKMMFIASVLLLYVAAAHADPIPVKNIQGATRGFLVMHSETGLFLAGGELTQVAQGDRVTSRLVFRFRDGSVDDDNVIFSQHDVFRLISEHHIQKGPFFKQPMDITVDVAAGTVVSRSMDKDGKDKVETQQLDFPADLANGMVGTLLINVLPDVQPFKIGMLAPTGKGRLVKLAITPEGTASFRTAGMTMPVTVFRVHVDIGGVVGAVAPIVGKQPKDTMVWVLEGKAPALIRQIGQLYVGGPVVSIELAGISFKAAAK